MSAEAKEGAKGREKRGRCFHLFETLRWIARQHLASRVTAVYLGYFAATCSGGVETFAAPKELRTLVDVETHPKRVCMVKSDAS